MGLGLVGIIRAICSLLNISETFKKRRKRRRAWRAWLPGRDMHGMEDGMRTKERDGTERHFAGFLQDGTERKYFSRTFTGKMDRGRATPLLYNFPDSMRREILTHGTKRKGS